MPEPHFAETVDHDCGYEKWCPICEAKALRIRLSEVEEALKQLHEAVGRPWGNLYERNKRLDAIDAAMERATAALAHPDPSALEGEDG